MSPVDNLSTNNTQAEDTEDEVVSRSAASKLFDIRYLIGALFTLYGVVLIVVGLFDNDAEIAKAAGIAINLWTGIGMLIVGLLFLTWARLRPVQPAAGASESAS